MTDIGRAPDRPVQAALDEFAGAVVTEHTMDSMLPRVVELTRDALRFADEVSITVASAEGLSTVSSTGALATMLDEAQYAAAAGPCVTAARDGVVSIVPDLTSDGRWPEFAAAAGEAGVQGMVSVPLTLAPYAGAAINSYSTHAGAIDDETVVLAQRIATYAGTALSNLQHYEHARVLAEQLQQAMDSRAVIDQAKGVLMAEYRCTGDEAFEMLKTLSQNSNRKLRDVATALVAVATGQDAEAGEPS